MLSFYISVLFSMDTRDLETNEWRLIDSTQSSSEFLTDDESVSFSYTDNETSSSSSEESTDSECRRAILVAMENPCCPGCWYVLKDEDGLFIVNNRGFVQIIGQVEAYH